MTELIIRDATASDYEVTGAMMAVVYAALDGFPTPEEQPDYYRVFSNLHELTEPADNEVIMAISADDDPLGAVLYIGDMRNYGAGDGVPVVPGAAAIRLLAVDPKARGKGAGRALMDSCIERARTAGRPEVVLHSTQFMQVAWAMYEKMGFRRSPDLDFMQGDVQVCGFRLPL